MSAPYVYQLEFNVKTDLASVWAKGLQLVLEAHKSKGLVPEVYTTFIGNGEKAIIRVPLESLADMDKWTHTPTVVENYLHTQKSTDAAGEMTKALEKWASSFTSWESRILRLSQDGH